MSQQQQQTGFGTQYHDGSGFANCDSENTGHRICAREVDDKSKWCSECVYTLSQLMALGEDINECETLECRGCDKIIIRDSEEHNNIHINENDDIICQDCVAEKGCDCVGCEEEEEEDQCSDCKIEAKKYCDECGGYGSDEEDLHIYHGGKCEKCGEEVEDYGDKLCHKCYHKSCGDNGDKCYCESDDEYSVSASGCDNLACAGEEEEEDQYLEKCDHGCGTILTIDTPIMCWTKGDEEKTLCSTCYYDNDYNEDDDNEDNKELVECDKCGHEDINWCMSDGCIDHDAEEEVVDCVCGNNHEKGLVDGVMRCEDCDIDGKNYEE
tara:strand:- start:1033 stop:2004 length:972 start_codon:yes stop_codon:yes gene_type:complete